MGSHLADSFLSRGYLVRGIDNLLGGYESNVPKKVEFHNLDLDSLSDISPVFQGVDLVVHAACTAYEGLSVFSPALVTRNTSQITANIVSACVSNGVKKIVYLSSMARYGTQDTVPFLETMTPKPQDPYGIAKYASEMLISNVCSTQGLSHVILVPHNIIGPRQKYDDPFRNVASIMVNRMLQGKQPIIYGDGNQRRCFSFMEDVVTPIMVACESDVADGLVVNIGPDEEFVTINELAQRIADILKFDLNPIYMRGRPQEVMNANCSADLARSLLNYSTSTTLDSGLRTLIEWIQEQGVKRFDYHLPLEFQNESTPTAWTSELFNE